METSEDKEKPERSLSPVLNNSNLFRRTLNRKRNSKTRVNLSERFQDSKTKSLDNDEFHFKKPISPASKVKTKPNVGFSTASGKNIHISPSSIKKRLEVYKSILQTDLNDNPTVFRKDFSVINTAKSDFMNVKKPDCNLEDNAYEASISDSQIVLAVENAVAEFNKNKNTKEVESAFIGFTVDEYNWSYSIVKRFSYLSQLTNTQSDCELVEPSSKKPKLESQISDDIFDNTLCNVFAEEDMSLLASVCNTDSNKNPNKLGGLKFSTGNGQNILTAEENTGKEEVSSPVRSTNSQLLASGFSTPSGHIFEQAWKKSEKIFSEENHSLEETCNKPTTKMPRNYLVSNTSAKFTLPGYSTAAGAQIKTSEEALQKERMLLANDLAPTYSNENYPGFSTAAGSLITISDEALKRSKKLFADDLSTPSEECSGNLPGFTTAAGRSITISDEALKRGKKIFADDLSTPSGQCTGNLAGFTTAAGGSITISDEALKRSKKIFADDLSTPSGQCTGNLPGFATAAGGSITISDEALKRGKKLFGDDFSTTSGQCNGNLAGFATAAGGSIQISAEALRKGFATARGESINISDTALKKSSKMFSDECLALSTCVENKSDFNSSTSDCETSNTAENVELSELSSQKCSDTKRINTPFKSVTPTTSKSLSSAKKRLGLSACKQIPLSKDSIAKAMLRFTDLDEDLFSPSGKNQSIYSSTPLKSSTPQQIAMKNKPNFLADLNITPVKYVKPPLNVDTNSSFILQEQTPGDSRVWLENVIKEYNALELKLKILEQRKKALEEQQKCLESQNNTRCRPVLGVLSEKRLSHSRITLKEAAGGIRPGDNIVYNSINFQNAVSVHFNCARKKNEYPAVFYTEDRSVIIPNLQNLIGFSEIEVAFRTMIGVDSKLIPKGWIKNHFRLIVWKLASLDRNLANVVTKCLTVENIIQQLKYRYDREIDKAERSALHRILEKDDVPQKRMVLCVSNIIMKGGECEIELTDGWYCIPTVIDHLLKFQISVSRIVIGSKLVVQGAEILNCDGCHPLEIPDQVRLKINFNCTRRAVWYAKLGFQKNVKPFPVSISSLRSDGGNVGCIHVQIIRVHPLQYLEKNEKGKSVWRNRRSEDRRQQEWENEQIKKSELIMQKVREDYEKEMKNKPSFSCSQLDNSNLEEQILYQKELSMRVSKETNKLKQSKRQVHPVFKVLLIDHVKENNCTFVFNIWNASEDHLQLLKEGSNFFIYNVSLKSNGDLASTNKTYFEVDNSQLSRMEIFHRFLLPISSLQHFTSKKLLINEYDTVGTVVLITKQQNYQEVWVTDVSENLLQIKVFGGPHICSLFDNITRGQSVAFLNIIFCEPRVAFAHGIANQCSIVTSFPQQKFLQTGLEKHIEALPTDLSKLLDNCDNKIKNLRLTDAKGMGSSVSASHLSVLMETTGNNSEVVDDSLEDNTIIPSRLTTTDVAMSLIDTDQYFENN